MRCYSLLGVIKGSNGEQSIIELEREVFKKSVMHKKIVEEVI